VEASNGADYVTIDAPLGIDGTELRGINDFASSSGNITAPGDMGQGFVDIGGRFAAIDDPLAVKGTDVWGVNNWGEVVGTYYEASGRAQGFVEDNGSIRR